MKKQVIGFVVWFLALSVVWTVVHVLGMVQHTPDYIIGFAIGALFFLLLPATINLHDK